MRIKHYCSRATLAILMAVIFGVLSSVKAQDSDPLISPLKSHFAVQIKYEDFARATSNSGWGEGDSSRRLRGTCTMFVTAVFHLRAITIGSMCR